MLVLSRKKDEKIILKGPNMDDICITVVRIDNRNKVRIGIEADKNITVLRSELDAKSKNHERKPYKFTTELGHEIELFDI